MQQLESYTAFLTEAGGLVLVLPPVGANVPENPKIVYDGGEHALFYKTPTQVYILDYLNKVAQEALKEQTSILLFEVNTDLQMIIRDYDVPVELTPDPLNISLTEQV